MNESERVSEGYVNETIYFRPKRVPAAPTDLRMIRIARSIAKLSIPLLVPPSYPSFLPSAVLHRMPVHSLAVRRYRGYHRFTLLKITLLPSHNVILFSEVVVVVVVVVVVASSSSYVVGRVCECLMFELLVSHAKTVIRLLLTSHTLQSTY